MMSTLHHIRLAVITVSLLLPLAVGCGEIELPINHETPKQEEPSSPADDDHNGGESREEPPSGDDNRNQGDGNDNHGDGDGTPSDGDRNQSDGEPCDDNGNQQLGRATLTADGHIVIDGTLYLSVIEYGDIKGSEATKAISYAESYAEGTLTEWRVPTRDDVKILTDVLTSEDAWYKSTPMALLNWALEESDLTNYDQLPLREGDGTVSVYFLCDGGKKAYTFDAKASKQLTDISAKKKYRLRLVKDK